MKIAAHPEAFEAILLRPRMVDGDGNLVNEDSDDLEALPAIWALADRLSDEGVPPQMFVLGRCRLLVISEDDSEIAKMCLLPEDCEGKTFIRARLIANEPNAPEVGGGDVVAVLVSAEAALVYEVVVDASEVPAVIESGAIPIVTLPAGETVLELRADLDLIGDAGVLAHSAQGDR
jgi:hypothetical protein